MRPSEFSEFPAQSLWIWADVLRELQGSIMDGLGFAPRTQPSRVVKNLRQARLLAYQPPDAEHPVVLAVPAPIKATYIWDLLPEISVVKTLRSAQFQVYLVDWRAPKPDDQTAGLEEYAEKTLAEALSNIAAETGTTRVILAAHSLGGTLAAIFASLHPESVRALVELEGPMQFTPEAGALETAVARGPPRNTAMAGIGNVAGSFLDFACIESDSRTFLSEPWTDWSRSLASARSIRTHCYVRRWTLSETPMPRRLFEEVVDKLYRHDRFAAGTLNIGTRRADPRTITAPILGVMNPRSRIVPPVSMEAYLTRTGSDDVRLIEYRGDVGIVLQHLGLLVGEKAHKRIWPQVLIWMRQHSAASLSS
jgi:polyhydroxyalkanoate synthase subunit PhaC